MHLNEPWELEFVSPCLNFRQEACAFGIKLMGAIWMRLSNLFKKVSIKLCTPVPVYVRAPLTYRMCHCKLSGLSLGSWVEWRERKML